MSPSPRATAGFAADEISTLPRIKQRTCCATRGQDKQYVMVTCIKERTTLYSLSGK